MRKRKLFQKLGISCLAAVMAITSAASAASEVMTENMVMTEIKETEITLNSDAESDTEVEKSDTEVEKSDAEAGEEAGDEESETEETEKFTEPGEWKSTDATEETEEVLTERITEQVTEKQSEMLSTEEDENSSEKVSEEVSEEISEKVPETNSEEITEKLTESISDTEQEKGSEPTSGTVSEEETDQEPDTEHGIGVLTAASEDMDMTILAPDDSAFPDGAELILYAGKELEKLYGTDGERWEYEEFLEYMKTCWQEEIQKEYSEETGNSESVRSIQYLYPYYFKIVDKTGADLELTKDVQVYINIYDPEAVKQEKSGQYLSKVGYHESGRVRTNSHSEVYCNTDKKCLAVDTGAEKCGLYSLVQMEEKRLCLCDSTAENELSHAWNCPVFYKALEKVCDCGSGAEAVTKHAVSCNGVWKAFQAACSECEAGKEERGVLHDDCEVVVRIHRELCECEENEMNLEKAVEMHDEGSAFVQYVMKLADYLNSQIEMIVSDKGQIATEDITRVSGWSNGSNASTDYLSVKFYDGKSTMEMLGGETVAGKWIQGSIAKKSYLYWLPLQSNLTDRSSHGARYNNVIYDYKTGKWYDMKFVIQSYQETTLTQSGKTVYPFAGFCKNKLQFGFDRQGPMVIRCQILESGTSTEAKVKIKLPVWDIDNAQFVGIKQNNGSMDHRYYYTGAEEWLRAKNGVSIAGVSGFSYVEGKFGTSAQILSTPAACAVWEMTTSDFSFAFGYYNNATTSEATRWDRFYPLFTNTTIGDGSYGTNELYGVVSIYSQDSAPPALQDPVKEVSADNQTWDKKLNLSSITGEYYYAIEYTVLDTIPAYKFSSLVLSDTLPAGADYVGGLTVTRVEDGKNKTNWFTADTGDDKIQMTATATALSSNDFYGYTYRITFKVKMDPTEMEPVYQTSSGCDVYTVNNEANVTVKRGSAVSGKDTNTVTTTASGRLPVITVLKKNERKELLEGAVYQVTAKDNITSLAGKTIYKAGTVVDTITTGKDGKAVSEKLHPGNYTVTEVKAPLGYALNKTAKDVKVSYLAQGEQTDGVEISVINKRLYSTISVTKEIDAADIVWAHGNPIFTFKVEGKDVLGNKHIYYDTVEFTNENIGSGTRAAMTVSFQVLSGTYTISEERTARYQLDSIYNVVNGSVSGETAVMHVQGSQTDTTGPSGEATFYNRKTTDEGQSHTTFVRNSIKK